MMEKLRLLVSRRYEAFLLKLCVYVLSERNVPRALVISRTDNNWLWEAGHRVKEIATRIQKDYQ